MNIDTVLPCMFDRLTQSQGYGWWVRAIKLDVITFETTRETPNSRHVGKQGDNFYGDLGQWRSLLIVLLVCVESDRPLICNLKQLHKHLPV